MKRTDYIYFVIDVSKSMQGVKIGSVNDAINNILHRLKKITRSLEINIKLVVITFSEDIKCSGILPINLNSFVFEDLIVEKRESRMGQAFSELNDKLQRQEAAQNGNGETTIILFSDGLATDDYKDQFAALNLNRTFKCSNRIVFTYGSRIFDLIKEPLCLFADKEENVIVDDFLLLNKMVFETYR